MSECICYQTAGKKQLKLAFISKCGLGYYNWWMYRAASRLGEYMQLIISLPSVGRNIKCPALHLNTKWKLSLDMRKITGNFGFIDTESTEFQIRGYQWPHKMVTCHCKKFIKRKLY